MVSIGRDRESWRGEEEPDEEKRVDAADFGGDLAVPNGLLF